MSLSVTSSRHHGDTSSGLYCIGKLMLTLGDHVVMERIIPITRTSDRMIFRLSYTCVRQSDFDKLEALRAGRTISYTIRDDFLQVYG